MVSYRTTTQIVADLLDATEQTGQEGIRITHLLSKANLSHSRLSGFIKNLTGSGLINKIQFDGTNTFVITQRGREYLESYRKFSSIAESFGLEL
ncbi:MAG: winged helix-turn-helix domain-containing protein [Nitrosopumilus sp.]|nr:winged helix-turn-helix domain-containing protein [Nitrosopumilus sp.]MDH3737000.1 winged helix-turn-helix domain-containing protein [Nitrosopumilus sp.]MDH3832742.1 winged helix-turn-helix domain-containing protein [Nitrosopumilus sp.]